MTVTDHDSARQLLGRWAQWWWQSEAAPDRLPNGLHARTALTLAASGQDDPIDLLREWVAWWATCNAAPPEMPDALNVRTMYFLAKWGLAELLASGVLPAAVGVCPLCFAVSWSAEENRGEVCRRCRRAHAGIVAG